MALEQRQHSAVRGDRFPPLHRSHFARRSAARPVADAGVAFFAAFPDGRVKFLQQMLVEDRIVSHLRVTGTFMGSRKGTEGAGQAIDYLATDIMRVADGLIAENWLVEDHETRYRQLGVSA
jgi:predicted ester cyclase